MTASVNTCLGRALAIMGIALPLLGLAGGALAEGESSLGSFDKWEAFTYNTPESKVCYVFSAPAKSDASRKAKRSDIYFMVTHWPGRKVRGQPSTMIGYQFKQGVDVTLTVGEQSFILYPVGELAWTDKAETEQAIIAAMKSGRTMTVKGISQRGTETEDTYSLNGFTAALGAIDSACK